jgi:hypothetical protein
VVYVVYRLLHAVVAKALERNFFRASNFCASATRLRANQGTVRRECGVLLR